MESRKNPQIAADRERASERRTGGGDRRRVVR
jgi:hypothetical protein